MSKWSNSSWCYCHLILGELKIEKSVIHFGGIMSAMKTPAILPVNEPGQCNKFKIPQKDLENHSAGGLLSDN